MLQTFLGGRVIVKVGDLTLEEVDAIVNAANSGLMGGGGVDGAIHATGGSDILEECRQIRSSQYPQGLPTGQAVMTSGGRLAARHVIHTVGPIYGQNGPRDAELLAACYTNPLSLAAEHGIRTISFPSISTGVYGYPKHEAASVVSTAISESLPPSLKELRLVFHSENDAQIFLHHQIF
jgi:O-acetyl-ADP-ribose deacetylase (regulator of RNase III)